MKSLIKNPIRWLRRCLFVAALFGTQVQAMQTDMRLILPRSPMDMNPYSYLSLPEWYVHNNITATLVELSYENEVVPGIAKTLNVSEDGKTYRFVIDDSRKWSDGSQIKASEVLASFTNEEKHKNAKLLPKILKKGPIAKAIFLENGNTLVFHLEAPVPRFLYHLATPEFGIVDVIQLRKSKVFTAKTRTSGDYKIAKLTKNELVLEPSPHSKRLSPDNPKRIVFSQLTDQTAITTALRKGEIDFYEAQSEDILSVAKESDKYEILDGGLDNLATLQTRSLSKDELTVVRALGESIDRSRLAISPKKEAFRLVAYSIAPRPTGKPQLSIEDLKATLPKNVTQLRLSLGEEATRDQLQDAEMIKDEAKKLGVEIVIEHPVKNFRAQWERESYGMTLTRMGVYAEDEAELLHGYFCTGFEPYKSLQKIVCSDIDNAMKPGTVPKVVHYYLYQAYEKLAESGKIIPLYHFPRRFLVHKRWTLKNYNRLSPFPIFARFHGK